MAKKPLGTDSMGIQKTMRIGDYLADCGGQFALNAMTGLVSAVLYFYTEKHRKKSVLQPPRRQMCCWQPKSWTPLPT